VLKVTVAKNISLSDFKAEPHIELGLSA